jgi:fructose-bisphosphate aldolase class I
MVVSGYAGSDQAGPEEVAERTLQVLRRVVPPAVPGIVFLSGGQDDEQATANLDAVQRAGAGPWIVSFSYARALQGQAMATWGGHEDQVEAAQRVFRHRTRMTGLANHGRWTSDAEHEHTAGV